MLEVPSGFLGADRRERFAQYLYQSVLRAGSRLAQNALDLGERFLYRVVLRRVRRQVDQLATPTLDQLPHPDRFVCGEVVQDHNLPGLQGRRQDVLYVSIEDLLVGGALHGYRLAHPIKGHRRQERRVLAAVARHRKAYTLAFGRVTVERRKRGVHSHLVHEHQPLGVDLRGHHNSPGGPQELVSFSGASSPFCASNRSGLWRDTWWSGSPKRRLWPPRSRSAPEG